MQESKERCIYSKLYAVCYVFRAVRCWLISPRWCRRARRDVYTVSCMLCVMFSGRFVSADFASLIQESKERCIYIKLYAVCYVFRAVRCWLISPRWFRRARRDVYTLSCMLCVMFSGRFVVGWFRLADAGEQGEMYELYTVSCMMCVVFSGRFVAGWLSLADSGEQGEMYIQ